jgi:hypothetical protein
LQKSGRALEQYVNYGLCIGNRFAYPLVEIENNYARKITLDPKGLNVEPPNAVVVEIYGNNALGNIMFMGRPILRSDITNKTNIVRSSRMILPHTLIQEAPTYTLNKGNVCSNNYYLADNCELANV